MARERPPLTEVIRVGAPRGLLADLYVHIVERSWAWFVVGLAAVFVLINAVFAGLFMLGGDCIAGAESGSFSDAFFFSVQSFSTIGYGGLLPKTPYADALVAVESVVAMMGAALATGLAFAKFGRPRANLIFSNAAVVTQFDGKPTLMIRIANARGIELVEATVNLTLLRSYTSAEGHQMRRLYDLKLMRPKTPIFTLSWQVMHVIDAESPLRGVSPEACAEDGMVLIATLTGHDSTYGQTVHDRHVYEAGAIRWGHRFVDVITRLDRNRVRIDFHKFHDVEEDEPWPQMCNARG